MAHAVLKAPAEDAFGQVRDMSGRGGRDGNRDGVAGPVPPRQAVALRRCLPLQRDALLAQDAVRPIQERAANPPRGLEPHSPERAEPVREALRGSARRRNELQGFQESVDARPRCGICLFSRPII